MKHLKEHPLFLKLEKQVMQASTQTYHALGALPALAGFALRGATALENRLEKHYGLCGKYLPHQGERERLRRMRQLGMAPLQLRRAS